MKKLAQGEGHIPYRDSKLTFLLQAGCPRTVPATCVPDKQQRDALARPQTWSGPPLGLIFMLQSAMRLAASKTWPGNL